MPFHPTTGNQTLRGFGILLLVALMIGADLGRTIYQAWKGTGTRQ